MPDERNLPSQGVIERRGRGAIGHVRNLDVRRRVQPRNCEVMRRSDSGGPDREPARIGSAIGDQFLVLRLPRKYDNAGPRGIEKMSENRLLYMPSH